MDKQMNIILADINETLALEVQSCLMNFGHNVIVAAEKDQAFSLVGALEGQALLIAKESTIRQVKIHYPDIVCHKINPENIIAEDFIDSILSFVLKNIMPAKLETVEKTHIKQMLMIVETYE